MNTWTADRVLGQSRGYMESRILLTAAELDLFTPLAREALAAEEIARRLAGDLRATTIVLDALAALELLEKRDGRYRCPEDVARLLSADSPQSVLPMVRHHAGLWKSWSLLTEFVRGTSNAQGELGSPHGDDALAAFIGAMHVVASPQAAEIVRAIEPGDARALIDVGGASGTYVLAFLEAAPQMCATLFDRPPVVEMARRRMADAGVLDRVTLAGGDFYAGELPGKHDLAFVSAIIHQNSPAQNVDLFRKVLGALQPGGRIVVRDHVMSADRTQPARGAVFAVNMLVRTEGGNVYTFDEIRHALTEAGFERVRLIRADQGMDGLVEAYRPR